MLSIIDWVIIISCAIAYACATSLLCRNNPHNLDLLSPPPYLWYDWGCRYPLDACHINAILLHGEDGCHHMIHPCIILGIVIFWIEPMLDAEVMNLVLRIADDDSFLLHPIVNVSFVLWIIDIINIPDVGRCSTFCSIDAFTPIWIQCRIAYVAFVLSSEYWQVLGMITIGLVTIFARFWYIEYTYTNNITLHHQDLPSEGIDGAVPN